MRILMSRNVISLTLGLSGVYLLSGCAYLTNYTQPINLRDSSVSIDVKQRVVFSQGRSEFDKNGQKVGTAIVVCAEPSPDALTVLGASGGLSVNSAAGKVGNASLAYAESGASIGLRTQSIQLLRDAMYRLCEGYAAGAVSESDFAAMQRRYQSTMMGLIAIEQLTGPIVAAQTMLTSSASSQSGASAGDAAVDAAQTKFDLATEATLRAQTEYETSQATLETTQSEIKSTNQKLAAEKSKKDPDQATIDAMTERLVTLASQEKAQQRDLADKKRRLDDANLKREEARSALAGAKAKVAASAGGTGRLGDVAGATRDSNVAFAEAVREIVSEINRSYSRDGCLTLLTELARSGSLRTTPVISGGSTDIEKAQQRVVELRGALGRLEEITRDLDSKRATVPAGVWADAREKYERTDSELKFALENLKKAQSAVERTETAARAVDGTTVQAVEVCQSILAAEKKGQTR
jgi:predicted  nucleic acid-binding Zn-ribbon protein